MANEGAKILYCRGVKDNATPIAGAVGGWYQYVPGPPIRDPGGAGQPGTLSIQNSADGARMLFGIMGRDVNALEALIGDAAANKVFQIAGAAGALEKITLKNGKIIGGVERVNIPDPHNPPAEVQVYMVTGECEWAVTDTFALMLVKAADA